MVLIRYRFDSNPLLNGHENFSGILIFEYTIDINFIVSYFMILLKQNGTLF